MCCSMTTLEADVSPFFRYEHRDQRVKDEAQGYMARKFCVRASQRETRSAVGTNSLVGL